MIVPVWASTGNFLLTMRGERSAISLSYSLPFLLVGVVAYGLVSIQGSAEALRAVQEQLHFTHYTVGHAHSAMYFFVSFLVWGSIYGLVPRITGREPEPALVGAHFWFGLGGMVIYAIAMWIAGVQQGDSWLDALPFMHSVRTVVPMLVWRAVGGTFMLVAHVLFAVNLFRMRPGAFTMTFEAQNAEGAA